MGSFFTYSCVHLTELDVTFMSTPDISGKKPALVDGGSKPQTLQSPAGHKVTLLLAVFLGQWFTVDSKGVLRSTE